MPHSFQVLDVPAPVLLDVSRSPDGATLHLAWQNYQNPGPVVIDGVPTEVSWMTMGLAAYDEAGNGQAVVGAFGVPTPDGSDPEITIGAPPYTGVQRFIACVVFMDVSGMTYVGQSPPSNEFVIDFDGGAAVPVVAPLAATTTKKHGKGHA